MHSLTITFVTIAAALSTLAITPAARSQTTTTAAKTKSATPSTHKVVKGETMWSIAQRHQTSVGEIMEYNKLSTHLVREGMNLKIPTRNAVTPGKPTTPASTRSTARESIHIVRSGDTFWTIAEQYKISPEALAKANPNFNPNRIHPEMELTIPAVSNTATSENSKSKSKEVSDLAKTAPKTNPNPTPTTATAPTTTPLKSGIEHTLAPGETFYSLSKTHGIKLNDIIAANPTLKPERLRPGTKIILPGVSKTASTKPVASNESTASKTLTAPISSSTKRHLVTQGDSITSIAQRYSISPQALLRQNNLKETDSIYIDDVLVIPTSSTSHNSTNTAGADKTTPSPSTADNKEVKSSTSPSTTNIDSKALASNAKAPAKSTSAPLAATGAAETKTTTAQASPSPDSSTPDLQPSLAHTTTAEAAPEPKKPNLSNLLEVAPDGSIRSYIISAGETEETICEAFGISKKDLFEHNKLPQGAKLRPGDEIMIPATTKTVVSR